MAKTENTAHRVKKVYIPLGEYNPNTIKTALTNQYKERFFKLFCSIFDFEKSVSAEERIVILKLLWEMGSFSVSRSPAPLEQFEEKMDLTFTPFAVDDYDFNMQPLHYHNTPIKEAKAVSKKKLKVGKTGVIVYLNEYARLHPKYGAMKTAQRYIRQIVSAKMTINTNLLLHKLPFVIPCAEEEADSYKEMLRQVFSDSPAVLVPLSMRGNEPKNLQLTTPYIIDKLESFITRLENQFLDEIGVDNVKPVQGGQDRLLLDESNANNALINNFRDGMFETLQEGFEDVKTLFGREITIKPKAAKVSSVHEDINGSGIDEDEEEKELDE